MERPDHLLDLLKDTAVALVGVDGLDLNMRQLAVLLICHLDRDLHTVRGLAAALNVARNSISRTTDRLVEFGLARRIPDPRGRRSILIETTEACAALVDVITSAKRLHGTHERQSSPCASAGGFPATHR